MGAPRPYCLTLLLLLGTSCGDLTRYRECQSIAETANPRLQEIEALGSAPEAQNPTPNTYQKIASRYADLKRALKALPVSDGRLRVALGSYSDMIDLVERQLRQHAKTAAQRGSSDQLRDRAQQAMVPVLHQQQTVLARIRSLCKP